MKRIILLLCALTLTLLELSCSGGGLVEKSGANVYLVVIDYEYTSDISVCSMDDIIMESFDIESQPVRPTASLSDNDDVILKRWVVTPYRIDGGPPSPVWTFDFDVHIPAGGTSNVGGRQIYPANYFLEEPLLNLFPENGGYDPFTGYREIFQSLRVDIYGETVSGEEVSVFFVKEFHFACQH